MFASHLIIQRAHDLIREPSGEFGQRLPTTAKRARASFIWNRVVLRLRGASFHPREESQIPPRELMLIDIYTSVGMGLGLVDTVRGAGFQARGLRRRFGELVAVDGIDLASGGELKAAMAAITVIPNVIEPASGLTRAGPPAS